LKLADITTESEQAFFRCLHIEAREDLEITHHRRAWYKRYAAVGYRARVLRSDDGVIVGKCHTIPIEYSPFVGQDMLAILCIYVHLYAHSVGDQRRLGYGRFMLEQVEQEANTAGYKGVVGWGVDWDIWNPVSFYEHMGYQRADQQDKVVAVWKTLAPDAKPPALLCFKPPPFTDRQKVHLWVVDNQWCDGNDKLTTAREAIEGIEHMVAYNEADPPYQDRVIHIGCTGGVFLDGEPYRPYQLIGTSRDLRQEIIRRYETKTGQTNSG
jgi:hypothetical protein